MRHIYAITGNEEFMLVDHTQKIIQFTEFASLLLIFFSIFEQ